MIMKTIAKSVISAGSNVEVQVEPVLGSSERISSLLLQGDGTESFDVSFKDQVEGDTIWFTVDSFLSIGGLDITKFWVRSANATTVKALIQARDVPSRITRNL